MSDSETLWPVRFLSPWDSPGKNTRVGCHRRTAMSSSRGSSQPRDWTASLMSPTLVGGFFTTSTTWEGEAQWKNSKLRQIRTWWIWFWEGDVREEAKVEKDWGGKKSVWPNFIPTPKKGNAKECSNYQAVALISHSSKVMHKILQARLQQNMNHELPGVQDGFRKGKGTRDRIANIRWIIKKTRVPRKTLNSVLLTMWITLTVWIKTNCGKFLEMGIPDHLTCLLRNLYEG